MKNVMAVIILFLIGWCIGVTVSNQYLKNDNKNFDKLNNIVVKYVSTNVMKKIQAEMVNDST